MIKPSRDTLGKVGFVCSVAVLAFLYGYATRGFGWPPEAFLTTAHRQVEAVLREIAPCPTWSEPRVHPLAGVRVHEPTGPAFGGRGAQSCRASTCSPTGT